MSQGNYKPEYVKNKRMKKLKKTLSVTIWVMLFAIVLGAIGSSIYDLTQTPVEVFLQSLPIIKSGITAFVIIIILILLALRLDGEKPKRPKKK